MEALPAGCPPVSSVQGASADQSNGSNGLEASEASRVLYNADHALSCGGLGDKGKQIFAAMLPLTALACSALEWSGVECWMGPWSPENRRDSTPCVSHADLADETIRLDVVSLIICVTLARIPFPRPMRRR
jgi:hypothetical protein